METHESLSTTPSSLPINHEVLLTLPPQDLLNLSISLHFLFHPHLVQATIFFHLIAVASQLFLPHPLQSAAITALQSAPPTVSPLLKTLQWLPTALRVNSKPPAQWGYEGVCYPATLPASPMLSSWVSAPALLTFSQLSHLRHPPLPEKTGLALPTPHTLPTYTSHLPIISSWKLFPTPWTSQSPLLYTCTTPYTFSFSKYPLGFYSYLYNPDYIIILFGMNKKQMLPIKL